MKNIIELIFPFLFIETLGVLFVLAGIFRWQYPQIFRWESWKHSAKSWVRFIKIVVGTGLIITGIYFGIERYLR